MSSRDYFTMYITSIVLLALVAQSIPPAANPEGKAKAQFLLKEGANLYEKGDLAAAYEKFDQAYAEYPSPKLLFNIGQTTRGIGRLADAMNAFERFLDEDPDAPAVMRTEAKNSVAELQPKLGRLQIVCDTPGAEINVDGKLVGTIPLSKLVWVMPGNHQVTAQHPNATPALQNVDVVVEAVHAVTLQLLPLPKPEIVVPSAVPAKTISAVPPPTASRQPPPRASLDTATTPLQPTANQGWWLGRKWTWMAAGSAVVFAGGGAIFGASMQSKFDSLNHSCGSESGTTNASCSESDIEKVTLRRNVANLFWGLSGAAAVTAGLLFFIEGRSVQVMPVAGETAGILARTTY
jgi:hypothetical protein